MKNALGCFSLIVMRSLQRRRKWLLVLIAVVAIMHGVAHHHDIDVSISDHAAAPAQSCAVCVSASTSIGITPFSLIAPASHTILHPPGVEQTPAHQARSLVGARAPPLS